MGETKRCGSCGEVLPLSAFNYRDRAKKKHQSYCRDCSNAAWRRWYANPDNKERHIAALMARRQRRIKRNKAIVRRLKDVPCADCEQRYPTEAMDFDHLEGKEELISKLVYTASTERLLEEVRKCEVVCANCHRLRTAARIRSLSPQN